MRAWRLRTSLILLLALSTLVAAVVVGAAILTIRLPQIQQEASARARESATQLVQLTEYFVGGIEAQLVPLAHLAAQPVLLAPLQAHLDTLVQKGGSFDAVYIANGNGLVKLVALSPGQRGKPGELIGADLSAKTLYRAARQSAQPVWSDKYLSIISGELAFGVGLPAGDKIIIGEVRAQRIVDIVQAFTAQTQYPVIVLDSRAEWIGGDREGNGETHINWADRPTIHAALAGQPPPPAVSIAGRTMHPGYASSPRLGWIFATGVPGGMANPAYRNTVTFVIFSLFGAFAVGLLLAPLWAARMLRPIKALIENSHRIAAGNYTQPWPRPGAIIELNELTDDLKRMAEAIELREDAIRDINAGLEERVAERTEALSQANEELDATVQNLKATQGHLVQSEKLAALGNLVAGVAHELNTPLGNGLMAVSTLAGRLAEFNAARADGLRRADFETFIEQVGATSDIAIRNLNRAAELIGSFKQVAVDQTSAQRRKFDLAEVVDEIVVMMQPSLKRTPFRIEEAVPAGLVLDSYPGALGQVLTNLINNAVLHGFAGRDHGVITITAAAAAPDSVQLTVQDDGCGIPADRQARIFDPFYTTRLGQGGSGLGLHISHTAVTHILGGTLTVASTPGAGAVFTLLLPRQAPSANPAHVDDTAAANGEHQ